MSVGYCALTLQVYYRSGNGLKTYEVDVPEDTGDGLESPKDIVPVIHLAKPVHNTTATG